MNHPLLSCRTAASVDCVYRDDVSKIKRDGFIPRWRKVSTNVHTYCQISICVTVQFIKLQR